MKLLLVCLLLSYSHLVIAKKQEQPSLVVFVSKSASINAISRGDLIDIYLGRYDTFPNGRPAKPHDLVSDSKTRSAFYHLLIGRTEQQINAYWARLLFSGRAKPLIKTNNLTAMVSQVADCQHCIGYAPKEYLSDSVKVVFEFEIN